MLIIFLTRLQSTKATSADSNFGMFSPFLSLSTCFFPFPNSFIVSGVNSSNLQPIFILKTILSIKLKNHFSNIYYFIWTLDFFFLVHSCLQFLFLNLLIHFKSYLPEFFFFFLFGLVFDFSKFSSI